MPAYVNPHEALSRFAVASAVHGIRITLSTPPQEPQPQHQPQPQSEPKPQPQPQPEPSEPQPQSQRSGPSYFEVMLPVMDNCERQTLLLMSGYADAFGLALIDMEGGHRIRVV